MRIPSLFLALLFACSPVEPTNVSVPSPDLALADLASQPQSDLATVTGPTRIVQRVRTGGKTSLTRLYLGSTCTDASTQIPPYDFYALSPVPPSTFAAGTFNY